MKNKIKIVFILLVGLLIIGFNNKSYASINTSKSKVELKDGRKFDFDTKVGWVSISIDMYEFTYHLHINGRSVLKEEIDDTSNVRSTITLDPQFKYSISSELIGYGEDIIVEVENTNILIVEMVDLYAEKSIVRDGNGNIIHEFYYENDEVTFDIYYQIISQAGISGDDTIINNIDTPYTIEEIIRLVDLKAYDDYDGDITHKIIPGTENYLANKSTVGTFYINFSVTNSSNKTTTYKVNVVNKDFQAPTIVGPTNHTISYKESMSNNAILALYTFVDNVDQELTLSAISSNYETNTVGTFNFVISATDKSNNNKTINLVLIVNDDIKPVITDNTTGVIMLNYKTTITKELLLQNLTATDEIDGDITSKIEVTNNPIKPILETYLVTYKVTDKAGNIQTFERNFQVISTDEPTFWVSSNVISIEIINNLTIDELARIIASYENIILKNYEVLNDNYTTNSNIVGRYNVKLNITDEDNSNHLIDRTINVFEKDINKDNNIAFAVIGSLLLLGTIITIIQYNNKK